MSSLSGSIQQDLTPALETMDRGSSTSSNNRNDDHEQKIGLGLGTDAMKDTLQSCETMEIRQDRRGCLQECFCCLTKSNFRYLIGEKNYC